MKRFPRYFLPAVAGAILLLSGLALFQAKSAGFSAVSSMLGAYGFQNVAAPENIGVTLRGMTVRALSLDPDGFSKIGTMWIEKSFLSSKIKKAVIDDLQITGEMAAPPFITLAGWTPVTLPQEPPQIGQLIVNGAKIDLNTPEGMVRLEFKADMKRDKQKHATTLNAALWGTQHQIKTDTRWAASWEDTGAFELEGDIQELRLKFRNVSLSRAGGWLSLSRPDAKAAPLWAGQMDIGLIDIGTLHLNNVNAILDGPLAAPRFIVKGAVGEYEGMTFDAEIRHGAAWRDTPLGNTIQFSLIARDTDDLIEVLKKIKDSSKMIDRGDDALMTLLLTDGNIARLKNDLKGIEFDVLELLVSGTSDDLSGKIYAKKIRNGVLQRHVISLNPSENPDL